MSGGLATVSVFALSLYCFVCCFVIYFNEGRGDRNEKTPQRQLVPGLQVVGGHTCTLLPFATALPHHNHWCTCGPGYQRQVGMAELGEGEDLQEPMQGVLTAGPTGPQKHFLT